MSNVWTGLDKVCVKLDSNLIVSGVMPFAIEKVIFNEPATIVLWEDGTKTVVKCMEGDTYSQEMGLAMCICKKALGEQYHKVFKEWITYEPE